MKTTLGTLTLSAILSLTMLPTADSRAAAKLDIDLGHPGAAIPPIFYGLMTEEINHSYDGGLFAELIQNRTFQDPGAQNDVPAHWSSFGAGKVSTNRDSPVNEALPINLRLNLTGDTGGVANDGYWGIPIWPNTTYTVNFYAKAADGFSSAVTASLVTNAGNTSVAKADTLPISNQWKKYTLKLTTAGNAATTADAKFVLSAKGTGNIDFSFVSLFPPTYQNVPNGLRVDIMRLLADMRPAFIRLPGGNYVEGSRFPDRFDWKKMIGPADHRPGHMGCWSYRSSDGFGLPEYLLWCKQLGAEPVLAVFAGYTLNGEHVNAGSPELAIYTTEALQEIEYVAGPASSEWGSKRAADGFAEPFPLHYVEIGNEDWFDRSGSYDGRFTQIAKAIRAKYPNLKIIATAPVTSFKPDLYDDHLYANLKVMLDQWDRYNPRPAGAPAPTFSGGGWNGRLTQDGIHTFMGEWATQSGKPTPNLKGALGDAVFAMALERNSDAVTMQCYAPLFANVNPGAWQWGTNLIGYDALQSFGSPSYHVLAAFGQNRGDVVIPAKLDAPPVNTLEASPHGMIGVGSWRTQVEYQDIVVTGADGKKLSADNLLDDKSPWQFANGEWAVKDGSIKSVGDVPTGWALAGDPKWDNYNITLRARKLSGEEGFLILWHAADGNNYRWWNIGGWGNTQSRCELAEDGSRGPYGPGTPFQVEPNRWYDLRLEISGHNMRGFIDDQLVIETSDESSAQNSAYAFATASYINQSREIIVKVVNTSAEPMETQINVQGATQVAPKGKAIVIAGELDAVNTVDKPANVAPKEEPLTNAAASFTRTFAPHSITLLRFPAAKR